MRGEARCHAELRGALTEIERWRRARDSASQRAEAREDAATSPPPRPALLSSRVTAQMEALPSDETDEQAREELELMEPEEAHEGRQVISRARLTFKPQRSRH